MNHLPFTLLAYFFNSLSVLANKSLLKKTIPDPAIYIFYISLLSLAALLLLPFVNIPTVEVFNLASLSTVAWTLGAYFMLKALKEGQVSRVIPIIGTLIPLILLFLAQATNAISIFQTWAVIILVLGMVFLSLQDFLKGVFRKREIIFEILSAAAFAFSYIALREVYLSENFLTVLVWSRLVLVPFCALVFLILFFRHKIFTSSISFSTGNIPAGLIFLGGQISGVISEILLLFSISLANPALVNSLQGTQFVFLLIFAVALSKKYPRIFMEKYSPQVITTKLTGIILVGIGLYLLAFNHL